MIPDQWYAVLESNQIRRGKPIGVTRLGKKVVFWRDERGQVACVRDFCPHRGAALSLGEVAEGRIACPFHGLQFDATGRCQLIPANGRQAPVPKVFQAQVYPVREVHGFIWVWWGKPRDELPPVPFFSDVDESFTYGTFRDYWPVHYSRAIENQLDVMHLPFVHHTTIGRGHKTVVDGPIARWQGDELQLWVSNRVDDCTPHRKAGDLPEPQQPPMLTFLVPNLWQNRIGDDIRVIAAFAPVDDENTFIYFRFYQRFVRVPVLRQAVNLAGRWSNQVIARQDKSVVATQRPKRTDAGMEERLVHADRPVIMYRERRRALIEAAQS
jgi:phenylpropionate dioxygenase-like ring-hydroxylating dioxygenase large terminal subunit